MACVHKSATFFISSTQPHSHPKLELLMLSHLSKRSVLEKKHGMHKILTDQMIEQPNLSFSTLNVCFGVKTKQLVDGCIQMTSKVILNF